MSCVAPQSTQESLLLPTGPLFPGRRPVTGLDLLPGRCHLFAEWSGRAKHKLWSASVDWTLLQIIYTLTLRARLKKKSFILNSTKNLPLAFEIRILDSFGAAQTTLLLEPELCVWALGCEEYVEISSIVRKVPKRLYVVKYVGDLVMLSSGCTELHIRCCFCLYLSITGHANGQQPPSS